MIDTNQIKNIILDCDGVIFDSNKLKTQAFEDTLTFHKVDQENVRSFIDYHKAQGGVSRYIKFEYLIKEIMKVPFDPSFYQSLLEKYSEISQEAYLKSSFTDGCNEFLSKVSSLNIRLFVASGSDEAELNTIFKLRNIDHYFNQIFGSPKTKYEILTKFILPGQNKDSFLMIGDAIADMDSSYKAGIKGIAMKQYSENLLGLCDSAEKFGFATINNLSEII
ncbi:HAD family hydrolase [Sporocytophaga myxococcoides]|uniref:HAD family hydrolase n=1 Tax=Sporocytophaga myxococcoides TaxID=153721 RepID=UPI00041D27B3|nr:HAD hydrolase-like protein [Sporocytophaga myxococcoides]